MHSFHSKFDRRRFLKGAGALAASAALPTVLFAHTGGSARLVVVILRGALDGLAAVPPYADPHYADLHRELAIAAPGSPKGALALNGTFGLHPSFAFLHERSSPARPWYSMPSPRRTGTGRISTDRTCSRMG